MPREYQHPKVSPDKHHGQKFEHPAYATVNISRVSGGAELFDSALKHQHFISLSIKNADKFSDGTNDFIFGKEELIEVRMSESQFTRAITSMNMGSGGPCTLVRFNGQSIPGLKAEDLINTHTDMVENKLTEVMECQAALAKQIEVWREVKHRPTLKEMDKLSDEMQRVATQFKNNMGYYARCFEEHMEWVVDGAKTEIEAHILKSANRLGIDRDELPALEMKKEVTKIGKCVSPKV